jgi:hypothetical protein
MMHPKESIKTIIREKYVKKYKSFWGFFFTFFNMGCYNWPEASEESGIF